MSAPQSEQHITPEEVLVSWRDCKCEWWTKYCDEEHLKHTKVSRSALAPKSPGDSETLRQVRELADAMWAEGVDWFNRDELNPGEAAGALHAYADELRAALDGEL